MSSDDCHCHTIATPSVHQTLDEVEFERSIWSSDDCHCHTIATPSVHQTLDEVEFERGIWSSALNGELKKLQDQLQKGIDPSVQDSAGYTALHYAARNGKGSCCCLLLERGANVNAQTPGGATPLLRAASQGHVEIVKLLLKFKADPSICDSDGRTPLHKAAEGQHVEVAKLLVNHTPQLKYVKDRREQVPLFYADSKCIELVKLLSI